MHVRRRNNEYVKHIPKLINKLEVTYVSKIYSFLEAFNEMLRTVVRFSRKLQIDFKVSLRYIIIYKQWIICAYL